MIASAVATFGPATAGIPIAQTATRFTVQLIFQQLIRQIAINLAMNVGTDLAVQAFQAVSSERKSWDAGKTLDAGIAGVAGGIAGGLVGTGGAVLGNASKSFAQAAGRGAVEGAIAGAGGNVLTISRTARSRRRTSARRSCPVVSPAASAVRSAVRRTGSTVSPRPGRRGGHRTASTPRGRTRRATPSRLPTGRPCVPTPGPIRIRTRATGWSRGRRTFSADRAEQRQRPDRQRLPGEDLGEPPRMVGHLDLPDPPPPKK